MIIILNVIMESHQNELENEIYISMAMREIKILRDYLSFHLLCFKWSDSPVAGPLQYFVSYVRLHRTSWTADQIHLIPAPSAQPK